MLTNVPTERKPVDLVLHPRNVPTGRKLERSHIGTSRGQHNQKVNTFHQEHCVCLQTFLTERKTVIWFLPRNVPTGRKNLRGVSLGTSRGA